MGRVVGQVPVRPDGCAGRKGYRESISVLTFDIIIWMLIISGISLACLGLYSLRFIGRIPAAAPYALLMFSAFAWTVFYALELMAGTLQLKILYHNLRFLVLPFMAVIELWLVIAYVERTEWLRKDWAAVLLIMPVAAVALGVTSSLHSLFRYNFSLDSSGPVTVLRYTDAPFYTIFSLYSLVILTLAIAILVIESRKRGTLWRAQTVLLIIALAFPTMVNYLFPFGLTPVQGVNMTAPLLWISAILYTVAIFRYRFLDIIPIARSRVINEMSLPMIVVDQGGTVVDINPAATSLLGGLLQPVTGKHVRDLAPEWPEFPAFYEAVPGGHAELVKKDGQGTRIYSGSIDILYSPTGLPEGKLILLNDITGLRQAEEALKESEAFNRGLVENLPDYIIVYTPDGTILYVNPATERALGYSAEELVGSPALSYIPVEHHNYVISKMAQRTVGGEVPLYETEILTRDGGRRSVVVKGKAVRYHNRSAFLILLSDITERKLAEDSLHLANRKLNLLSTITRHDINNQLTVLIGYQGILQDTGPGPLHDEYLQKATTAAERIATIIRFTKEYENIGVNLPSWQEARALVDTAAKQSMPGTFMLENKIPAGAEIFADPLIVKVFYNLMDNAVRHGGKITTIRFSLEDRDGGKVIVCEDDGEGVAADEKEKIFERGFGKNTGLGLPLSREILSITGITITENGEPGKGARFEMTVPKGVWRLNPGPGPTRAIEETQPR